MTKTKTTNVILSPKAQIIKDRLSAVYLPTKLFSAGVLLFNELTPEEREKAIYKAMDNDFDKDIAINYLLSLPAADRQEICRSFLHEAASQELAEASECKQPNPKKLKSAQ